AFHVPSAARHREKDRRSGGPRGDIFATPRPHECRRLEPILDGGARRLLDARSDEGTSSVARSTRHTVSGYGQRLLSVWFLTMKSHGHQPEFGLLSIPRRVAVSTAPPHTRSRVPQVPVAPTAG